MRENTPADHTLSHQMFTRRSFLAGSAALGLGAATVLTGPRASAASPVITPLPAAPTATPDVTTVVSDLEVLTATTTSLVFAWSTFKTPHTHHLYPNDRVASDGEVWLAPADSKEPLRCVHRSYSKTGFHYVTIQGLKPNTRYRYECRSLGKKATPGFWFTQVFLEPEVTGVVSTIPQPTGRYIQTVAVANDIHLGMEGAGITEAPWSEVMIMSMLQEIKRRNLSRIYINGDLCDHGTLEEAKKLRGMLNTFGKYHKDYFLVRGNHEGYDMKTMSDFDPIHAVFPKHKMQTSWSVHDGKLRVVGIDGSTPSCHSGSLTDENFRSVEKILLSDPHRPTLVLSHFPVTEEAALTNAGQRPFIYNKKDSMRLQRLFQKAPGVFFMAAGHTHRAHRDAPDLPGGPQFAQFCATAPFPGGFTLMDIYEGGYTVTFHRTPAAQALAQTAFNRYDKAYGCYGEYTISRMCDRCYTVKRDMSALR